MQRQTEQADVYQIDAGAVLFGSARHVLEDAVPPIDADQPSSDLTFGWVEKGLPLPGTGGLYVVEFLKKRDVRVLAYVDLYGRVFSTNKPLHVPPAREPNLLFEKYEEQSITGEETGCVYVHDADAFEVKVAQYRREYGHYDIFDSWFYFGRHGGGLSYNDAMARAYLAFVHRPSLGAPEVSERGLWCVVRHIDAEKSLASLRQLVAEVRDAQNDPALRPPALARCLTHWLVDAGLDELTERGVKDDAIHLVQTVRYANTYYVSVEDENAEIPLRTVWALEAALNRFLLLYETFDDLAASATETACARWDARLIETIAMQQPILGGIRNAPRGIPQGEWALRCAIGTALERLRLPVRFDASMRADVSSGVIAFEMIAPDGSFMPTWVWREGSNSAHAPACGGWEEVDASAREAQARRYAMHLGLILATAAFDVSPSISRVDIVARPFTDTPTKHDGSKSGEFSQESVLPAYFQVSFDRASFDNSDRFSDARMDDPTSLYEACAARFDVVDAAAFASVNESTSAALRYELPELHESFISEPMATILGVDNSLGMRISFDSALRHTGESLADRIVRAQSASDTIRIVRAAQEEASAMKNDRTVASCTRLMAALAEGDLEMDDQNAIVGCFLGEDRCLVALGRARTIAQRDPQGAADVLIAAVEEASALDGFVDGATTVYRSFDSYAARVLYNRARCGDVDVLQSASADAGKRVELVPDSFYICHLEITQLLEHSFERTDEALRFGQRATQMAPTTAAGYRHLGRAYMLVGDMENAAATLLEGLHIAVQPADIAMAYYQLAYVLWKMGRSQDGATCYLKSLAVSPVVALQATSELQELLEESDAVVSNKKDINEELMRANVPVAPTSPVLDMLGDAAAAATDAGLFPVARNLLVSYLHYRPEDALMNVLRSLEE